MFTFLTCTYNRAHTLERLFHSFEKQTFKDFDWLIIDDGSRDNTATLINNLKTKSFFPITYVYKKNGGKYTALLEAKKYLSRPFVVVIDSDDEVLSDCLEIFNRHLINNPNIQEIRSRCVDSNLSDIGRFKFPPEIEYIDTTWHNMVLKKENDDELLSCFKTSYFLEAVNVPSNLIFVDKFKCFSEGYFWSRIKGAKIRYIKEVTRIYHHDSGNSIMNNTQPMIGYFDDIVAFKYFLDENYNYITWRPKYFISMYIKLTIASIIVGNGFINSHFLYDKWINRLISILISPVSLILYLRMKFLLKKFWR